jgi:cytoskeletal protein RodZ
MSDGVTLSNILGSQVSIQWYEAVALVREVADRLVNGSSERAIPELQQIRLSAEGHVEILGVIPTNEPVRRMGQLLQALLAHADAPVQLRLIITQATSPVPPYQSIREYSDALGFFERPERSTVLQSLASRVTAAAEAVQGERPLTLDSIAPLPTAKPKAEEQQPVSRAKKSRSRAWAFALVAVVILAVSAAGVWYARKQGLGPQNREEASALADKASDAVGSAILSGASAVTETLGLGRIVPAKEEPSPAPSSPPDSTSAPAALPKPSQPKRRDSAASSDPMPAVVAFDLDPTPTTVPTLSGVPTTVATTDSTAAVPASKDDDIIYSVETPSIAPPVGIRPKLARQLPPDFDPARLGRVELIIGTDGSVESAKLLGPPRTVNDGLFLSVAKAWTFQPALKGGVPVRYRKTIWVASP